MKKGKKYTDDYYWSLLTGSLICYTGDYFYYNIDKMLSEDRFYLIAHYLKSIIEPRVIKNIKLKD